MIELSYGITYLYGNLMFGVIECCVNVKTVNLSIQSIHILYVYPKYSKI